MNSKIIGFLAVVLMASTSMAAKSYRVAQYETDSSLAYTGKTKYSSDSEVKGIRISLLKPILSGEVSGNGAKYNGTLNSTIGFGLGYASLPTQELGWSTNAALLQIDRTSGGNIQMYRVDGNLGYAFNEIINVKGGLNVSNFMSEIGRGITSNLGFGLQASVGAQITKNFGGDLGLVTMNQTITDGRSTADFKEYGLELAAHATF